MGRTGDPAPCSHLIGVGGAMIAYDTRHNPPAPMAQVTIANIMQRRRHRYAPRCWIPAPTSPPFRAAWRANPNLSNRPNSSRRCAGPDAKGSDLHGATDRSRSDDPTNGSDPDRPGLRHSRPRCAELPLRAPERTKAAFDFRMTPFTSAPTSTDPI